jgi:hypothetical protein
MIKKLRPIGLVLAQLFFLLVFFALAPRVSAQSQTGTLTGNVEDPTGAVIPGANITLTRNGQTFKATSGPAGHYIFRSLPPGVYSVSATESGFAPFSNPEVAIAAGQVKGMNLTMAIAVQQQQVQVTAESGPTISTSPANNTNTLVMSGKALNALSNDPTELANELQALAGPAAGPNGGQIFVNGFTGGQIPPKSDIERIIVNRNPFSAQYDRLGFGRIEIVTKPGTNKFTGQIFGMGNDSSFNTLNPFTGAIPSYYSYMLDGAVGGPISKNASFFLAAQQRNTQNDNIYTTLTGVLDPKTNTYVQGSEVGGLFSPAARTNIIPRIDLQLGQNNTLSLLYEFYRVSQSGNLTGSTSLPSQAFNSDVIDHIFQVDDTQIISNNLVNETRIEFRHRISTQTPASTAPSFSVPTDFVGGGVLSQQFSQRANHYELQNFTTLTAASHTIEFGAWLRDNSESMLTNADFNGNFNFESLESYLDTVNGLAQGKTVAQIAAACPSGQVCTPIKLTYTTGPEKFQGNIFDGALFYQDDWKVKPYFTFSYGLRFETENHIADHADWAPRFDLSYAIDGHKSGEPPKTLLQAGFGFFYHRLLINNLMNLEQYNGGPLSQKQTVIDNPTCFNSTSLNDIHGGVSTCGTGSAAASQIDTISPRYRSPYTEMLAVSLERRLSKASMVTLTYLHANGLHEMVTRDSNAYEPLPGTFFYNSTTGPRPDPNLGIVDQYYTEGIFKESQIIVNFNTAISRNFSIFGFYNYNTAHSDGGSSLGTNPSNSYHLMQDYGRSIWVHPQWMLLAGQYVGPWGISFNPFLIAEQGHPYNITTTTDLTGDNFFNNRPAYASASDCQSASTNYVQTTFGCLNTNPQEGDTLVPDDLGNAPPSVAMNLRLSRTFGVGPKETGPAGQMPPGGGGGGGHHHHFHLGGPFGGMQGGAFNGTPGVGRRYQLSFSVHALNIFNDIDYGTPSGSLIPTLNKNTGLNAPDSRFEKSTSLKGGIFSQGSAARRIYLHAEFDF